MKFSYWIQRLGALGTAMLLAVYLCIPAGAESVKAGAQKNQTAQTQLSGAVPPHGADYQVMIPAQIAMGSLGTQSDTVQAYDVRLELSGGAQSVSSVQITADAEVLLRQSARAQGGLLCRNSLTNVTLTPQNAQAGGTITISAEQVQAAAKGSYSGTLHFTITSTAPMPTATPKPSTSPAPSTAPTAVPALTPMPTATPTPTPTPTPTSVPTATPGSNSGTAQGNYTYKLSVRKSDNFSSLSMCDPLFYDYADVKVTGENAAVTLYVIDPIPKYASQENSPPLKDVSLQYNGARYSASLGSSHVAHSFSANSTFIGEAGVYNSLPLTFQVPYKAITTSGSKTLLCTAYVNAVMKTTQNFYLVFSDGVKGETNVEGTPTPIETKTVQQAAAQTAAAAQTGTDSTGTYSTGTSAGKSSLKNGTYAIPVRAKKAASDEDSMMTQYLYKTADLTVKGEEYSVTIYVQHTVAGIEGGGPKYIRYNGTNAAKKENAKSISGTAYDSFTFSLKNKMPSGMNVDMYISAMSMEVSARLLFDLSGLQQGGEEALEDTETDETVQAAAGTDAKATSALAKTQAEKTAQSGANGLHLSAPKAWQGALYLLVCAALGTGVYWLYKKRGL